MVTQLQLIGEALDPDKLERLGRYEVWTPLIAAARETCSECVFAAETLGCTPEQVEALRPAGFTYLFNSAAWWDFTAPYLLKQ